MLPSGCRQGDRQVAKQVTHKPPLCCKTENAIRSCRVPESNCSASASRIYVPRRYPGLEGGVLLSTESYTNVVVGSGEGGKFLAWHLTGSGQKTLVVERRWVGGSCPNTNCLPSK